MCGLLSLAENAMVILQPARDTRRYRRQSPVTLWHGWRGNHHLTDVISRDSFSVVMPLANSANCSPCSEAEAALEKPYIIV